MLRFSTWWYGLCQPMPEPEPAEHKHLDGRDHPNEVVLTERCRWITSRSEIVIRFAYFSQTLTRMGKRKSLTADDLLRQQEGPQKRVKFSSHHSPSFPTPASGSDEDESSVEEEDSSLDSDNEEQQESDETDDEQPTVPQDSRADSSSSRLTIKPRTDHKPKTSIPLSTTFSGLGISVPLQSALTSMSIRTPTEVQAACIPPLLQGK